MMGEFKSAVALLAVGSVMLVVLLAVCRFMGLWTWTAAWIFSIREEKVGLTRATGHYNANGILVNSDSEVHLETGIFKRFDYVDRDVRMPSGVPSSPSSPSPLIPPQPLRPAPAPLFPTPTEAAPPLPVDDILEEIVLDGSDVSLSTSQLARAMSCESVCSDTSVVLGDLSEPNVSGYLCVGVEYDGDCGDLTVSVIEAKELVDTEDPTKPPVDTFVRIYLLPDKTTNLQTRVYPKSACPSYNEKFVFPSDLVVFGQRSLACYVYTNEEEASKLIGEAELRFSDIAMRQPVTTWLTLTDTGQCYSEYGEVMFSLSYLPTAERLTLVVVKARNLKLPNNQASMESFVKVYLLQNGKKVHKKRTVMKRGERCPIFNEAMIFSVPPHVLQCARRLCFDLTQMTRWGVENDQTGYPLSALYNGSEDSLSLLRDLYSSLLARHQQFL